MFSVEVPGLGRIRTLSPMTAEEVRAQMSLVSEAARAEVSELDEIEMRLRPTQAPKPERKQRGRL